ncbi:helix-turn-helix domain-containing protein [Clostridium sardiniense]|uniref:Helix-turn-helix domain-containing protein n=1 Tax=Clostridium sardiniense TaxID=29369 RepID=A0ABS7L307_CLOSR|nr:helix-turn-helix domain-containing protein [Clostridium sardiniense]MBY0757449.1 helix-turn-helix domain-containing protein [Clostridium sardiniense]MDQ0462195.1 excisionase family DNA binding protein [Clostridium sardiniense]
MSSEVNPILLTPMQAKDLLGIGRNEIYNLCKNKKFPSFKIGKKYYINKDKLQEWADKQCK